MKNRIKDIAKALLFLGIGVLLIWLVTRNLSSSDKANIFEAFKKANYFWIVVTLLMGCFSHWLRAVRWKMLLEPLGHNPKTINTFFAVMVGYLANFALPRLGEVSRCTVLTRYEKIPFTESFGTVITERIVDTICLLIVFVITVLTQFQEIYQLLNEKIMIPLHQKLTGLLQHQLMLVAVLAIIVLMVVLFLKWKQKAGGKMVEKITDLLNGFWQGVKSIRNIKNPILFLLYSLVIWSMYFLMVYLCFYCFAETTHLGLGASLAVLGFGSIGIIFVPGGTGAYQAIVTQLLTTGYSISFPIAFAFSWIVWTSSLVLILLLGLISLVLLPILNKEKL